MDYEKYIGWKHWRADKFAKIGPGTKFYFNQILKNVVASKSKVLEIGFGNGELLEYFVVEGHEVVGVEINSNLVERARKSGYVAHQGLIWDIPQLQLEKFDLVVAIDVAEHLSEKELNALFSWVRRHLNICGKLILRFPEGASPFGLANQNGDFTHVTSLTRAKIEILCHAEDMELLSYSDDLLSSNRLCSFGFLGKMVLLLLQRYASVVKWCLRISLYPLTTSLRLGTNSIAVIAPHEIVSNNRC